MTKEKKKNLKCWIGLHEWHPSEVLCDIRICSKCGKREFTGYVDY